MRDHVYWARRLERGEQGYETGPDVLRALATDVLPVYVASRPTIPEAERSALNAERIREAAATGTSPASDLAHALLKWFQKCGFQVEDAEYQHFEQDWILDIAMYTLAKWALDPRLGTEKRLSWMLPVLPEEFTPPTRAGRGEYYHPEKFNKPAIYARHEFLLHIERLAPDVLMSLAAEVRPIYETLRDGAYRRGDVYSLLSLTPEILRAPTSDLITELAPLAHAISDWCMRWHLNADWVQATLLFTLFNWHGGDAIATGQVKGEWRLAPYPAASPFTPDEIRFSFSDSGWDLVDVTRAQFISHVSKQFDIQLNYYIWNLESRAEADGWVRTPQVRQSKGNRNPFRHLEWLVRWQVQNWTAAQIAQEYGLGRRSKYSKIPASEADPRDAKDRTRELRKNQYKAVHDALEKAAALVGLPLRGAGQASSAL